MFLYYFESLRKSGTIITFSSLDFLDPINSYDNLHASPDLPRLHDLIAE